MTRYLTLYQVLELHARMISKSGGARGILNRDALNASVQQPRASWEGTELYPTLVDKAAALAFSLIRNHCFLDGNKRVGHAAMVEFLHLNGLIIGTDVDEQERVILEVADGKLQREEFTEWLRTVVEPFGDHNA